MSCEHPLTMVKAGGMTSCRGCEANAEDEEMDRYNNIILSSHTLHNMASKSNRPRHVCTTSDIIRNKLLDTKPSVALYENVRLELKTSQTRPSRISRAIVIIVAKKKKRRNACVHRLIHHGHHWPITVSTQFAPCDICPHSRRDCNIEQISFSAVDATTASRATNKPRQLPEESVRQLFFFE